MCNPAIIPWAVAAVAGVTEVASVISEQKAAKVQNRAINDQYNVAVDEIRSQETADINDRLRAQRKEQARIKVAAGEAGLSLGGSVAGLLQDSVMQSALYDERVRMNAGHKIDAVTSEANSQYSRVQSPSVLGAGLRVVNAGVRGYSAGMGISLQRQQASKATG